MRRGTGNSALRSGPCLQSVEALQLANRRILDRLRPLHSRSWGSRKRADPAAICAVAGPRPESQLRIDPRLDDVDGLLSQTVYRVIQEGVTNVLRHANACTMKVEATIDGEQLRWRFPTMGLDFQWTNGLAGD